MTRDIERALGVEPSCDYMIVTNKTPYSEKIKKKYTDFVYFSDGDKSYNTADLLKQESVARLIDDSKTSIVVFKNNSEIESIINSKGWTLLNPSSKIGETIENKITQVEWLGILGEKYLPPHRVGVLEDIISEISISKTNKLQIMQWAHGHTGDGTILIKSDKQLNDIKERFPKRLVRVTDFVAGPSFTVNVIVSKDKILFGNISYQITGLPPFTDNSFSTIGNDWSIVKDLLNKNEIEYIHQIAREVGEKMRADGWKGLLGIDIIKEEKTGKIFLIEINARQPASTTFESQLQLRYKNLQDSEIDGKIRSCKNITVFEAHLLALQDKQIEKPIIEIKEGAQIIQRVTKDIANISKDVINSLESSGYNVITYSNTEMNSDLLRIQSTKEIMKSHMELNVRGKEIVEIIKK